MNAEQERILGLARELAIPEPVIENLASQLEVLPWEKLSAQIDDLTDFTMAERTQRRLAVFLQPFEGDTGMGQLALMLAAACHTREKYQEWGVPDNIYLDTFGCFSRFLKETKVRTGRWKFDRAFWTWRQTSGRLFRLGTLEFEYCRAGEGPKPEGLQSADMLISVHIPSDARLKREALSDSYRKMRHFFAEHEKEICPLGLPKAVICSSWLLSPQLNRLLKQDSGIRRFAQEYELYHEDVSHEDCFEWLFEGVEDIRALPEKTSLQRAVKAHLATGGKIGVGSGVLKI